MLPCWWWGRELCRGLLESLQGAHAALGAGTLGGGAGGELATSLQVRGGCAETCCARNRGPPQDSLLPQPLWKLCLGVLARRQGRSVREICLNLPQFASIAKWGSWWGQVCTRPGCGEVMQPTRDVEKGPELFCLYLFFSLLPSPCPLPCHTSPTRVPSSQGQGCHCCSPGHPSPALLSSGILLQRNPPGREAAVRLHSDA